MEQHSFSEPEHHSDANQETSNKSKNEWLEWLKAIIIAVVLVFLIRWLLFAPFIVDGSSMQPNFHSSERIIVNKISIFVFKSTVYNSIRLLFNLFESNNQSYK